MLTYDSAIPPSFIPALFFFVVLHKLKHSCLESLKCFGTEILKSNYVSILGQESALIKEHILCDIVDQKVIVFV